MVRTVERSQDRRGIAIVKTLLNTGLRIDELTRLKGADLDISPRKGEVQVMGKGSKHRVIPLNAEARMALLVTGPTSPGRMTASSRASAGP